MSEVRTLPLGREWKDRLGLSERTSPELYEKSDPVSETPHAGAIRVALADLGLSAIFSVQGVPTVAILSAEQYERNAIIDLHGRLWNQGLASVLLVIADDTLRAFSLAKKPYKDLGDEFERRCLIDTLDATADALKVRNFIFGAESGRLWTERAEYFITGERIDQVLLDNLNESHRLLCQANLSPDAAQALLIQTMFIAYLEDREIITSDYFEDASQRKSNSFLSLLAAKSVKYVNSLFAALKADFNGDLFVAPCSFESKAKAPVLNEAHLDIIARFRSGQEEMGAGGGQYRFWGYHFRYIPIELISAVYDQFLGEKEETRRQEGAYYTPMFLADTVVSQFWDLLSEEAKDKGRFLDPACGSGVFLVRCFQRLCERWRATHELRKIRWDSLLTILGRLSGWDVNANAVRVAVFSLYVSLLEEVSPPEIRSLISRGKLLPELWGENLVEQDFFGVSEDRTHFDVIVGNPPWTSRRGRPARASIQWCEKNDLPMPSREDAWAFVWKALRHLSDDGIVSFLLPAMGFLHNHAGDAVAARNRLIRENHVHRIINFADLRFQLFEGPVRPAALIVLSRRAKPDSPYGFEYWVPKADPNLKMRRLITLRRTDKMLLSSTNVVSDPLVFKRRLWMNEPESKLFSYFSRLPALRGLVDEYRSVRRKTVDDTSMRWIVGQGFQPFNADRQNRSAPPLSSQYVDKLPYLPIAAFRRLAQPLRGLSPWPSPRVRRKGFEGGFSGPRVLVSRGIETSRGRLRATYTEDALTFQDIIQAIAVPRKDKHRAKLLTALLNSRVAIWFAFHGSASFGAERPELKSAELLRLPFPAPSDLPDPKSAEDAKEKLIARIDGAMQIADARAALETESDADLREVDQLAYQYFCLSEDEIQLIEDTTEKIIPAIQPTVGSYPEIWKAPLPNERLSYAETLVRSLAPWLEKGSGVHASLDAKNDDLGVLRLSLNETNDSPGYNEASSGFPDQVLVRLSENLHQPLGGNFQLMPDFRVFVGGDLYLVKPMQLFFWLKSTALADADAVAMDLQDSIELDKHRSQT